TQLYYGIAFGKSQRDILTENLGSLDKLLNIIESNYRNGLVKKIDVEKVKINKSNLESELENLEMVISSQKNIFKILLDLPLTDDIELLEKFDGTVLNYITVNNPSAESTTDYRMLQKQLELTQKERSSIKSAYFPTVGFNYNYSYNWQSQNLGDLYGSDLRFPQQLIGLNVNIPIFDGRQTEFKLKQNKVKAIQLEQKTSFVKTKIEADIENAQLKYNQNVNAISTRQQNVNLAKSVYDQSVFEYREGVSSLTEVINSETALRTSQTQYLSSVSNALMALLEYKKATGSIMSN
ncbi:MAG: TolC family protein, partial [Spirosomaceae bacterium]|nr:TolC family protein [Spirosomataceae bacterium]